MMNLAVVNQMKVVMASARLDQDPVYICMPRFLSLRQVFFPLPSVCRSLS